MPRPAVRTSRAVAAFAGLLVAALTLPALAAHAAQGVGRAVPLSHITLSADGRTIGIEAAGPLPEPVAGELQNPPRIYIDLPGIAPGTATPIRRRGLPLFAIRVALNNSDPLITRIVLDLAAPSGFRVDSSARQAGRIAIILEEAPVGAAAAAPRTGTAPPPSAPRPATGTAAKAPAAGAAAPDTAATKSASAPAVAAARERYAQQVAGALARLEGLLPVLTSIEKLAPVTPPTDLQATARTFETIGRELAAVKPPAPVVIQHDMLQRACDLGARAARLRADSAATDDASATANASSAAAGAIMLITRARAEIAAR